MAETQTHSRALRAIAAGDWEALLAELESAPRGAAPPQAELDAMLFKAVEHRDDAIGAIMVRLLCDRGADPRAQGFLGTRPIHLAAAHCHPHCIRALASAGADLDQPTDHRQGLRPIHMAARNAHNPASASAIQALAELGADPRARDHDGLTALDFVAIEMNMVPVEFRGSRLSAHELLRSLSERAEVEGSARIPSPQTYKPRGL